MKHHELLQALFPQGYHALMDEDHFFCGKGTTSQGEVMVLGTSDNAEIGAELALKLSHYLLMAMQNHPGIAILILLDTQGQALRRRDEMLGQNAYMAHLAKCMQVARSRGHRTLSLVYGQAVSGGYLTSGMMADACYALESAEIKVMNLPAMARITKIPQERLEALSEESPVFSPGVGNYLKMGHLQAVWSGDLAASLEAALSDQTGGSVQNPAGAGSAGVADNRMQLGLERGGRLVAGPLVANILSA